VVDYSLVTRLLFCYAPLELKGGMRPVCAIAPGCGATTCLLFFGLVCQGGRHRWPGAQVRGSPPHALRGTGVVAAGGVVRAGGSRRPAASGT